MKARLVRIGNSRGVRLPKTLIIARDLPDRQRLIRRLGQVPGPALAQCLQTLQAMFAA